MCSGAILGIARAVVSVDSKITPPEVFKVILFAAIGAVVGLVVKDLYHLIKDKLK